MIEQRVAFLLVWPKCCLILIGVLEVLATIFLILTEIGNVAADFWITNVFAGGWCALVMIIHFVAIFTTGCCSPSPSSAFRTVLITLVALVTIVLLIGFDIVFLIQPSACILSSSCSTNAAQTNTPTYYFQQSFFNTFNALSPFQTYTERQAKFLFQVIQLGVGALCFILCVIYLIIYSVCTKEVMQRLIAPPARQQQYYQSDNQNHQSDNQNQPSHNRYQHIHAVYTVPAWRPTPVATPVQSA